MEISEGRVTEAEPAGQRRHKEEWEGKRPGGGIAERNESEMRTIGTGKSGRSDRDQRGEMEAGQQEKEGRDGWARDGGRESVTADAAAGTVTFLFLNARSICGKLQSGAVQPTIYPWTLFESLRVGAVIK